MPERVKKVYLVKIYLSSIVLSLINIAALETVVYLSDDISGGHDPPSSLRGRSLPPVDALTGLEHALENGRNGGSSPDGDHRKVYQIAEKLR